LFGLLDDGGGFVVFGFLVVPLFFSDSFFDEECGASVFQQGFELFEVGSLSDFVVSDFGFLFNFGVDFLQSFFGGFDFGGEFVEVGVAFVLDF